MFLRVSQQVGQVVQQAVRHLVEDFIDFMQSGVFDHVPPFPRFATRPADVPLPTRLAFVTDQIEFLALSEMLG